MGQAKKVTGGRFECVKECSQCCIEREYYPSKAFGKVGVLILPEERQEIKRMADARGVNVTILPRIGASDAGGDGPTNILAYQMMGRDADGNTCPFLDTQGGSRSPHGGFACMIYEQRPLACRAYPVIGAEPVELDAKCKFCQECPTPDSNIDSELEALAKIRGKVKSDGSHIWRFATGVGEAEDRPHLKTGWVPEGPAGG